MPINSHQFVETDMLLNCISEFKACKSDQRFLMENLTLEKRALLEKLIIDEKLKLKKGDTVIFVIFEVWAFALVYL